jgi:glutaredoxin 3
MAIKIYSKTYCPYCDQAKDLLKRKGQSWEEILLDSNPQRLPEMLALSGGKRTVPQIFIGATHVGGYDDLRALDAAGKLDTLLTSGG